MKRSIYRVGFPSTERPVSAVGEIVRPPESGDGTIPPRPFLIPPDPGFGVQLFGRVWWIRKRDAGVEWPNGFSVRRNGVRQQPVMARPLPSPPKEPIG